VIDDDMMIVKKPHHKPSKRPVEVAQKRVSTRVGEDIDDVQVLTKTGKASKRIVKAKNKKSHKKGAKEATGSKKVQNSRFFDMEADEGLESDEEMPRATQKQKEAETYSREFLKPKTERLNPKMLDAMMKKYETQAIEEDDIQIKASKDDEDLVIQNENMGEDVSRDIYLPSIKDSKLWRVNVLPGKEREMVFKITNKLIEYLNHGNPLNVLEVFECQLSQGVIYCEAYKIQHVEKVLQGLSGINHRSIRMIPINEMTEVMKSCQVQQKKRFQEHQWVRIKGGIYKDDLGLIEKVDGNKKATVRLVPRIPTDFYTDPNKNVHSLRAYGKKSQFIRVQ
jgi:hypothetical protein